MSVFSECIWTHICVCTMTFVEVQYKITMVIYYLLYKDTINCGYYYIASKFPGPKFSRMALQLLFHKNKFSHKLPNIHIELHKGF